MAKPAEKPAPEALSAYLAAQESKGILRFLTCGSVDDGKSTLIGRLLYDTKLLFDDQLAVLETDSRKYGTTGDDVDLALVVDGLQAEREQGITIDVAYRFFATDKRSFIVADTPGHEQYTRNMATGASNSELAVILVDARAGILTQTRRHSYIVSLFGIRHVVLAVNKIDLVGYSEARFREIYDEYRKFVRNLGFTTVVGIPMSARHGDNVIAGSTNTPWYMGPSLLDHLEAIEIGAEKEEPPLRFPVQWVNRPNSEFRGYSGTVASGSLRAGDKVIIARSGRMSQVKDIVTMDGKIAEAGAGEAVTLVLKDDIDVSRGDLICAADARPEVADQIAAHIIWMSEDPLLPGRPYQLKCGTSTVRATVTGLKHKIDVNSFSELASKSLDLNEIGFCNLSLAEPIAFDAYEENRATGAFILIDRFTNATVAAGMIRFGLRRATNVHWQALDIHKGARAEMKHQRPCMLWFTGLSGAGKSTIANLVEKKLHALGRHTYTLDGDNVRHGLNRDLGFTDADRVENIRRVAETAKLFVDAGLIVLVSFISPFRSERRMARELVDKGEFVEVFVDTPIEVCAARDPKGLYKRAMAGEIKNFTGIDSPYEIPRDAEIRVDTTDRKPEAVAEEIIAYLSEGGYLG
ncbi:MAG: sulfate adenylyltransferase subunit CysN [Hyphomicrobiales bacterium]|nr:sulfate adenylyltransferase subunit CysN [Hyphomicrobiales bacterium]